jgi:hypothetical protein
MSFVRRRSGIGVLVLAGCLGDGSRALEPPDAGLSRFGALSVAVTLDGAGARVHSEARFLRLADMDPESAQVITGQGVWSEALAPGRCARVTSERLVEAALETATADAHVLLLDAGDLIVNVAGQSQRLQARFIPEVLPFVSGVFYRDQGVELVGLEGSEVQISGFGGPEVGRFDLNAALPAFPGLLAVSGQDPRAGEVLVDRAVDLDRARRRDGLRDPALERGRRAPLPRGLGRRPARPRPRAGPRPPRRRRRDRAALRRARAPPELADPRPRRRRADRRGARRDRGAPPMSDGSNGKPRPVSQPGGHKRQRAHARSAVELPVSIKGPDGATSGFLAFDTRDLSLGGAFLQSASLLEVGEQLQLEIKLGGGRVVHARGRVVRVERQAPTGMGISFTGLDERDAYALKSLITGRGETG